MRATAANVIDRIELDMSTVFEHDAAYRRGVSAFESGLDYDAWLAELDAMEPDEYAVAGLGWRMAQARSGMAEILPEGIL